MLLVPRPNSVPRTCNEAHREGRIIEFIRGGERFYTCDRHLDSVVQVTNAAGTYKVKMIPGR